MDPREARDERATIDTNEFIKAIRDNPAIWNYSCAEYASTAERAMAWERIFRKFFENYDEMDQAAKKVIGK